MLEKNLIHAEEDESIHKSLKIYFKAFLSRKECEHKNTKEIRKKSFEFSIFHRIRTTLTLALFVSLFLCWKNEHRAR